MQNNEKSKSIGGKKYPVIVHNPESDASSSSFSCRNNKIFTIQMVDGNIKSFTNKRLTSTFWYGESETDGSIFNYLFDEDNGAFLTGSLNDLTTGDIIQFRLLSVGGSGESDDDDDDDDDDDGQEEEQQLFAFVRHTNDFQQD